MANKEEKIQRALGTLSWYVITAHNEKGDVILLDKSTNTIVLQVVALDSADALKKVCNMFKISSDNLKVKFKCYVRKGENIEDLGWLKRPGKRYSKS